MDDPDHPPSQSLSIDSAHHSHSAGKLTLWVTYSFASDWLNDAKAEAAGTPSAASRRREILFAVCFAESYLYEWVRDRVLERDFARLAGFFPTGDRRGIRDRWKEVTKELEAQGLIPRAPDLSGSTWQDFRRLVDYRDGLVHALASRPESAALPAEKQPIPTRTTLEAIPRGWATATVQRLVQELHQAAGTKPPDWVSLA